MNDASLRNLAAAIGTSDRMLLHYFADKEESMTAAWRPGLEDPVFDKLPVLTGHHPEKS